MSLFKKSNNVGNVKYSHDDTENRDIYDQRDQKRGQRPEVTSDKYIPITTGFVFVLVFLGVSFIVSVLMIAAKKAMTLTVPTTVVPSLSSAFTHQLLHFPNNFFYFVIASGIAMIANMALKNSWKAENIDNDNTDINQYENDAWIEQPEALSQKFDIFPDAGAHSAVSPTAVLSHIAFDNKGLKKVKVSERYKKNEDGHIKGSIVMDENGKPVQDSKPMIDEKFTQDLFTASFIPEKKDGGGPLRVVYDPRKLSYNPKGKRGKSNEMTVAEHINKDWEFPDYEIQRPGGGYIVDTDPNNTMVLAMTRAGKGDAADLTLVA